MRRFFPVLIALALAGCTTPGDWKEEKVSARLLNDLPAFSSVTFTLKDGRQEKIDSLRDFGDAICGSFGCVRKADVGSAYHQGRKVHVMGTLAMVPITGLVVAACTFGCNPAPGGDYRPVGPPATPDQQNRAWLDSLGIYQGIIVSRSDSNPCVGDKASAVQHEFANDREALDWIIDNRREVSNICLTHVANHLQELDRVDGARAHRESVFRLDALISIRTKWSYSRCRSGLDMSKVRFAMERLAPTFRYALDTRRGDPMALSLLQETLNDTTIYSYDGDLTTYCKTGIKPKEQWPDLAEWIAAHSPFAPAPALPPLKLQ